MTLALNSKNKLGFVNGSIKAPTPEADPEGYATWSMCNDMVHSWIVNTVSSEIADSIIYYPTAHKVWEDLSERFSQGNAPRIFEIQRDITSLRQEQQSVSAYYMKLRSLWDELASYSEASQGAQADQQKLMKFLMGLNETYSATRGQILLMNPLPSVRQAYVVVAQEEKQRFIAAVEFSSSVAAMVVRSGGRPNQFGSRGRHGDRPNFQTGWVAERGFTVTTTGIVEEVNGPAITLSEAQVKQFLAALHQAQKPNPNTGYSSKANAVTQPGSGYEEDDWLGLDVRFHKDVFPYASTQPTLPSAPLAHDPGPLPLLTDSLFYSSYDSQVNLPTPPSSSPPARPSIDADLGASSIPPPPPPVLPTASLHQYSRRPKPPAPLPLAPPPSTFSTPVPTPLTSPVPGW
ncbi:actin cytoskeleton-regulatory complex protein PAN1-like [Rosa chinensis]|uniref:actin cytoskeleton-regulatory complex protein PAN1-like n=1 Tax=Rosa chinensis TaxID=74649 RepID=UPI000D08ED13|nr:actin cytoskeleton-regulatory complex protein PAN1-like [Rosa chinensis]